MQQRPPGPLEILAAHDRIDLVISDVVMPEMQGPELVEEIVRRSPRTAAILISGFAGAANRLDFPQFEKFSVSRSA